jgi:antirestriction protein ArdC
VAKLITAEQGDRSPRRDLPWTKKRALRRSKRPSPSRSSPLELGAAVRKGETGSTVVLASRFTKSEADGKGGEIDREIPFLKAYSVFNVEQIDGLADHYYHRPAPIQDPVERIEQADRFFRNIRLTRFRYATKSFLAAR